MQTLVIGGGAEPCAYLLAAHDAAVTFIAADMGAVERVESPRGNRGARQHVRRSSWGGSAPVFPTFSASSTASTSSCSTRAPCPTSAPRTVLEVVRDLQRRSRPGAVRHSSSHLKSARTRTLLVSMMNGPRKTTPSATNSQGSARVGATGSSLPSPSSFTCPPVRDESSLDPCRRDTRIRSFQNRSCCGD